MDVLIQKITKEAFKKYGQVIENPVQERPTIAVETVTFWKQQLSININGETEVGVLKVKKRDMIFNEFENHFKTPTGLICLDSDFVLAVAPPQDTLPKTNEVEAFHVQQSQLIVLDAKCWHGECYPVDKNEITLLVIFQKDALDNDTVYKDAGETFKLKF